MRNLAAKLGRKIGVIAVACSAVMTWPVPAIAASRATATITIDGRRPGPAFDGIGAISGGGGNSRLLIDYPAKQRTQILNYLFGPGGADLQILKLEIGGDANSSDGAEPSVEHSRGQIDCQSGYEWWLARQALARNPRIKLYGLQWAAPGWVSSIWSQSDIGYVIDWLNCAKSHGLTISYLGGWNEHGFNIHWFESMRRALDVHGYKSVRLIAADAHPPAGRYLPATAWRVAAAAALHPAFRAAISVLGAHDTCGIPTLGYRCESTPAARRLGRPLWESELGTLDGNTGAANLARSINHGYFQAGITGYIEWPLLDSMPPGLRYENRGLVTADLPGSGYYHANRIIWAIAQTTQFVQPGWRHVLGANGVFDSGSYDSYVVPRPPELEPGRREHRPLSAPGSRRSGHHRAAGRRPEVRPGAGAGNQPALGQPGQLVRPARRPARVERLLLLRDPARLRGELHLRVRPVPAAAPRSPPPARSRCRTGPGPTAATRPGAWPARKALSSTGPVCLVERACLIERASASSNSPTPSRSGGGSRRRIRRCPMPSSARPAGPTTRCQRRYCSRPGKVACA